MKTRNKCQKLSKNKLTFLTKTEVVCILMSKRSLSMQAKVVHIEYAYFNAREQARN